MSYTAAEQILFVQTFQATYTQLYEVCSEQAVSADTALAIALGNSGLIGVTGSYNLPWNAGVAPGTDPTKPDTLEDYVFERAMDEARRIVSDWQARAATAVARRLALTTPDTAFQADVESIFTP